ncbi:TetR/AcrR family transcriptional regulator [Rhizobium panacihumi]|uniref:TetR/AcrR family transcriptional regulator n=1 Tax=Rhizobium panacihumi TaxID=2008450 RepID=UPI003D7AEFED
MVDDKNKLNARLRGKLRRFPRQERSHKRISEILQVTRELINEKGIDAVTMKEIGARTGGPIASVYQYFSDKEAVLGAVFGTYSIQVERLIKKAVTKIETPKEAIEAFGNTIENLYQKVCDEPAVVDVLSAVRASKFLGKQEIEHIAARAEIFYVATLRFVPEELQEQYRRLIFLTLYMLGAVLRLAFNVPQGEGPAIVAQFKVLTRDQMVFFLDRPSP